MRSLCGTAVTAPLAATDDHRADNHLEFIHETSPYRVRGDLRTGDIDVVRSVGLELSNRIGIKFLLNLGACAAWLG